MNNHIKPITNPAEHRAALAEIDSLMGAEKGTPEGKRLSALADLVVTYEAIDLAVQEAIDDTSPTVPHDEAMSQVRAALKLPRS